MGVAFKIQTLQGKLFLFVQVLAGQVVRDISQQNMSVILLLIKCLNWKHTKITVGTSTNLPYFTNFLLKYGAIMNPWLLQSYVLLDCRNTARITW